LGWHSEAGEVCTDGLCNGTEFMTCAQAGEPDGCPTVGQMVDASSSATQALFNKYGVDVYDAGHSHQYAVTWPMLNSAATQLNYSNPRGTVYLTEGNGGVPNTGPAGTVGKAPPTPTWGRSHGTGGAYGIFTTSTSHTLTYEHVCNTCSNGTGKVMETWALTEATHVQPALPPTPPPPPPPPPQPPHPPPAPPPAGYSWTCFANQSCGAVAGLKDIAFSLHEPAYEDCERTCNAVPDCVAVRYHGADMHCHALVGPRPTLASFTKDLIAAPFYTSCIMLKD
jgi:hypothetical protein